MSAGLASAASIHLICTGTESVSDARREEACTALAGALGQFAPSRTVRRAETAEGEGLRVTLHVTQALPNRIGGVLSWHDAGNRGGASPEIALRVVDSGLSQAVFRTWAEQLIAAAGLRF